MLQKDKMTDGNELDFTQASPGEREKVTEGEKIQLLFAKSGHAPSRHVDKKNQTFRTKNTCSLH
jgi:hypothetical protein